MKAVAAPVLSAVTESLQNRVTEKEYAHPGSFKPVSSQVVPSPPSHVGDCSVSPTELQVGTTFTTELELAEAVVVYATVRDSPVVVALFAVRVTLVTWSGTEKTSNAANQDNFCFQGDLSKTHLCTGQS